MISVYTVITGNFDNLRPPQFYLASPKWEYVSFSDRPRNVAPWVNQSFPQTGNSRLDSRIPKILPHLLLPKSEFSIYMDGAFRMSCDPATAVGLLGDSDLAVFHHPTNHDYHDEYQHYIKLQSWAPEDVSWEYEGMVAEQVPVTGQFYAGGVVVRRHCEAVERFNELWMHYHVNGSCNDQFSLYRAIVESGVRVKLIPGDPLFSEYFGYSLHASSGCQDNPDFEQENRDWGERVERVMSFCQNPKSADLAWGQKCQQ